MNADIDLVVGDAVLAAYNSVVGPPARIENLASSASNVVAGGKRGESVPLTGMLCLRTHRGEARRELGRQHHSPVNSDPRRSVLDADDLGIADAAHLDVELSLANGALDAIAALAGEVVDARGGITSLYRPNIRIDRA